MSARLHDARLAGRWYPALRAQLEREVETLLASGPVFPERATAALLVPHAGYAYSGRAAGVAYATVRNRRYARVVVLAPSHYAAFRGAAVLAWDGFATPMGAVEIDLDAVRYLQRSPLYHDDASPFGTEHALEIQLPFLQKVLPQVLLVPVLIGQLHDGDAVALAARLRALEGPDTLFLVSSDFTHYGARFDYLPFPPSSAAAVRSRLRDLDLGAVDAVCAGDTARFTAYVNETQATICGRRPIEVFLSLNAQRARGELLTYYTSLDVTGDYEHCVSYASIRFVAPE